MEYKVIVKLYVPEIEKTYDVYIPVNQTVAQVCILLNKMINEITSNRYPMKEYMNLSNRRTSQIYEPSAYIRDTDIRNGSQIVLD